MKKNLAILLLSLIATYVNAEAVTSTIDGGVVETLPKVGQVVKKGEMLVTFYHAGIDAEIDALKVEIETDMELLKTKILDKERADKLVNSAMSKSNWEEITYNVVHAKLSVKHKNAKLRKLEIDKKLRFIPAPCDCKVTEVYMIENSGTAVGDKILEVERFNGFK